MNNLTLKTDQGSKPQDGLLTNLYSRIQGGASVPGAISHMSAITNWKKRTMGLYSMQEHASLGKLNTVDLIYFVKTNASCYKLFFFYHLYNLISRNL